MLRKYRTCNLTIGFSKYEFNNKLLSGVTFLRVTSGVIEPSPIFRVTSYVFHAYKISR